MNKKVSIIIPVYNASKTIRACVSSLINQKYRDIEIVLVNDGSTDDTEKIIKQLLKKDDRIVYVKQLNKGVSAARNLGIETASGYYAFFIDCDDELDNNVIGDLVDNYDAGVLTGVLHNIVIDGKSSTVKYSKDVYDREDFIKEILYSNIMGSAWGYLYKLKDIKKIKFDINTNYLEDTLFLITYLYNNKIEKIRFIDNKNYYNYIQYETGITSSKKMIESKCEKFIYSLNAIDCVTKGKYSDIIEYKKIVLMEKELRFVSKHDEFLRILNKYKLVKCNNLSLRYSVFIKLYNKKLIWLLKLYYLLRKIVKGKI